MVLTENRIRYRQLFPEKKLLYISNPFSQKGSDRLNIHCVDFSGSEINDGTNFIIPGRQQQQQQQNFTKMPSRQQQQNDTTTY